MVQWRKDRRLIPVHDEGRYPDSYCAKTVRIQTGVVMNDTAERKWHEIRMSLRSLMSQRWSTNLSAKRRSV